jgi:hypothetical protein
VLTFANRFHPLVCENLGRHAVGNGFGVFSHAESELIKSLKNLSQLFGKPELYIRNVVPLESGSAKRASGLRAAGRGRRPLIQLAYWRHVGVNRHKVTTLRRVLSKQAVPTRLGDQQVMRVPDTPCRQFASRKQKNIHATPARYATLAPILH